MAGAAAPPLSHRRVWALAGPIILSNLSAPLLGLTDTAAMGHLDSPVYLGAVAVGTLIMNYLYWSFGFLRMGTTAFTAQAAGRADQLELRAVLWRGLAVAGGLGLLVLLLQWPIFFVGLQLIGPSDSVAEAARSFFFIRIWGAPAGLANFVLVAWFLGRGQTRTALLLQVFMNLLNVALNLLFVLVFDWGVAGVGAGTAISETAAVALGLSLILRTLGLAGWAMRGIGVLEPAALRRLFVVNRDIFIRTLCVVTAIAVFTAMGARQGDDFLAANAVLFQFFAIATFGLDGLAQAAEILVGRALGARDRPAFRRAMVLSALWSFVFATLMSLVFAGAGTLIVDGLTTIAEVRRLAREFLPWAVLLPLVCVAAFLLDGVFIGATRTRAMRNGMLASLAIYLLALWLLRPEMGNHGLWLSFVLFLGARAITLGIQYPALERSVSAPHPAPPR